MSKRLYGYEFYKSIGSPKYILAPMVDQSELAWRLLGRKYGVELAYTPMIHAVNFIQDSTYRRQAIEHCDQLDRPLIYQFCANTPESFTSACKLVENLCDAVDLNLGCPQAIAKRGHYGSFLQEDWDLIKNMLTKAVKEVKIPVTAKIRIQTTPELTYQYVKMLESCGISMLVVHGRLREQKGINTGLADWNAIREVKSAVNIPVIANGNIQYFDDIAKCLESTKADGVMSAEGHLHNPAIFCPGPPKLIWDMIDDYLQYVRQYPCPLSYSRGHVFKVLHHALNIHTDIREMVGYSKNVDDLQTALDRLKSVCGPLNCSISTSYTEELPFKHWFCQPYIRPNRGSDKDDNDHPPKAANQNMETDETKTDHTTYQSNNLSQEMQDFRVLQRMKRKEAKRLCKENRLKKGRVVVEVCYKCVNNQKGVRCEYNLCKTCCKKKRQQESVMCIGHDKMKRMP